MSKKSPSIILQGLDAGMKMFRWVVLVLVVMFFCSGITKVKPNEIALLLRFGELQGSSDAGKIKGPGPLLAMPYPIDRVIRVPVRQEGEVVIEEVWKSLSDEADTWTIDPLKEGYCLTGDQNIVQAKVVVKYKIDDPIEFKLWTVEPETILKDVVLASLTRTIASWVVDDAVRLQRVQDTGSESLAATVWRRAQKRLDGLKCGMSISALEFKEIHPPRHVINEFREVQSAKIDMETKKREAEGFASREIPRAESEKNRIVQQANAYKSSLNSRATAECSVFEQLCSEYQKKPALVWQRIYNETLEEVFQNVGKLNFVVPESRVILSGKGGP